jgi:hypothetical protein
MRTGGYPHGFGNLYLSTIVPEILHASIYVAMLEDALRQLDG